MHYFIENWFDLIQTAGIIVTLWATVVTLNRQMRQSKVSNTLLITQHHREIWTQALTFDDLSRVFDKDANIAEIPISERERMFVNLIFHHMSTVLKAVSAGAAFPVEGMEADIQDILSFPIPRAVWTKVASFHDEEYVAFVAKALNSNLLVGTDPEFKEVPISNY